MNLQLLEPVVLLPSRESAGQKLVEDALDLVLAVLLDEV
jgi:hypothetical protein